MLTMTLPQVLTIDLPEEISGRVGRVEFEHMPMHTGYFMRMYPPGEDQAHLMRIVPALFVNGATDPAPMHSALRKLYIDKLVRIMDQATLENPLFPHP
jgi:hypothetical protein